MAKPYYEAFAFSQWLALIKMKRMTFSSKWLALLICSIIIMGAIAFGIYKWVEMNTYPGNTEYIYFAQPSFSNDTIIVAVSSSSNPATSAIYLGFNVNDGGGAIHPDSYTRCVGNLTNNTSVDWIAFSDNDSDGKISINDTFMISRQITQIAVIRNGYYNIAFSNESKVRYIGMINIDASKV